MENQKLLELARKVVGFERGMEQDKRSLAAFQEHLKSPDFSAERKAEFVNIITGCKVRIEKTYPEYIEAALNELKEEAKAQKILNEVVGSS